MSHILSVTGIQPVFAKQTIVKQDFLLKQLFEIGPIALLQQNICKTNVLTRKTTICLCISVKLGPGLQVPDNHDPNS